MTRSIRSTSPSSPWKRVDPQTVLHEDGRVDHLQSAVANLQDAGQQARTWAGTAFIGAGANVAAAIVAPFLLVGLPLVAAVELARKIGAADADRSTDPAAQAQQQAEAAAIAADAKRYAAELRARYPDPFERISATVGGEVPAGVAAPRGHAPAKPDERNLAEMALLGAMFWWLPARIAKGLVDAAVHFAVGAGQGAVRGVVDLLGSPPTGEGHRP
jgi:hypothetical protein